MTIVVFNFSDGPKTRSWQYLRFARIFNDFTSFIWKASEVYLNEFTAAKYKFSEKFYNQKFSSSLNTKEM